MGGILFDLQKPSEKNRVMARAWRTIMLRKKVKARSTVADEESRIWQLVCRTNWRWC